MNVDGTNYVIADASTIGESDSLVILLESVTATNPGLVAHLGAGGILFGTNIGGAGTSGSVFLTITGTTTNTLSQTAPVGSGEIIVKIGYKRGANILVLDNTDHDIVP